jgi:hypothetical protein
MRVRDWLKSFVDRFAKEEGREPNPLEVAHNLPRNMSDGDAMTVMVRFMEGKASDDD